MAAAAVDVAEIRSIISDAAGADQVSVATTAVFNA